MWEQESQSVEYISLCFYFNSSLLCFLSSLCCYLSSTICFDSGGFLKYPKYSRQNAKLKFKTKQKRNYKKRKGIRELLYIFYDLGIFWDIMRLLRCSSSWWIEFFSPQLQRVSAGKRNSEVGIWDMGISPEGKGGCTPVCRPQWETHDTLWECTAELAMHGCRRPGPYWLWAYVEHGVHQKGILPAESVYILHDP